MKAFFYLSCIIFFIASCGQNAERSNVLFVQNDHIRIGVLPQVGGRLVFAGLRGHANFLKSDELLWHEPRDQKPTIECDQPYKPYWGRMVWPSPMDQWWQVQHLCLDKKKNKDRWPPDPYLIYGDYSAIIFNGKIELESPKSPITGLQFYHEYKITGERSIRLLTRATNVSRDTLNWGLWFNSQVPGMCRVFVPVLSIDNVRFKQKVNENCDVIPRIIVDKYFTFLPEQISGSKVDYFSKACIEPAHPFIAAFHNQQMLLIEFPKYHKDELPPAQSAVEIYNQILPGRDALLELETHSPYVTLSPGQTMQSFEDWTFYEYEGVDSLHTQLAFLKKIINERAL